MFLYLKWTIDFLEITLHIKLSFPLRISSVNMFNPQFPADLIAFTKEILTGKLHFLYCVKKCNCENLTLMLNY